MAYTPRRFAGSQFDYDFNKLVKVIYCFVVKRGKQQTRLTTLGLKQNAKKEAGIEGHVSQADWELAWKEVALRQGVCVCGKDRAALCYTKTEVQKPKEREMTRPTSTTAGRTKEIVAFMVNAVRNAGPTGIPKDSLMQSAATHFGLNVNKENTTFWLPIHHSLASKNIRLEKGFYVISTKPLRRKLKDRSERSAVIVEAPVPVTEPDKVGTVIVPQPGSVVQITQNDGSTNTLYSVARIVIITVVLLVAVVVF